jgi:hypothetical protein
MDEVTISQKVRALMVYLKQSLIPYQLDHTLFDRVK